MQTNELAAHGVNMPDSPKEKILAKLNPEQREAAETLQGPLLVLAGAGTGKTRVLTTRIANILLSGFAFPSQILAVTFTNKAAREMKERIEKLMADNGVAINGALWLGTFHSIFLRVLRKHPELAGLKQNFTIIDTDDQIRLLKQLLEEHNVDEKRWPAKALSGIIQRLKDQGVTPDRMGNAEAPDFAFGKLPLLYNAYQTRLKTLNSADFGDLLLHSYTIFMNNPDILAEYQRRFKYILVDEYQDTNVIQYLLLRLLAQTHKNICCVGDDDQSIYSWRGAEVANILRFENEFPNAKIVRLQRNYRSTKPILGAASKLISNNKSRLGKELWTEEDGGKKVRVVSLWDDKKEAEYVGQEIEALQRIHGAQLNEVAILVRAGFQTRAFEECFVNQAIPYQVIGGLRFYERQEIRDAIAYLRVTLQPEDDLALERIINVPRRGIGAATIDQIRKKARETEISFMQAIKLLLEAGEFKARMQSTLAKLVADFDGWRMKYADSPNDTKIAETILKESGYMDMWAAEKTLESQGRLENLAELLNAIQEFSTIGEFLEHVSLVMDNEGNADNKMVSIMTLHAAKGLEFETVFLPGWEEGLFPHQKSLDEKGTSGLEEERRLAYVGITRAKRNLYILFAASRRIYNQWQSSVPSRFIDELPPEHIETINTGIGIASSYQQKLPAGTDNPGFASPSLRRNNYFSMATQPVSTTTPASFSPRERVFHEKFGYGVITSISGSHLTISFDKAGMKTLVESFVKKV